MAFNCGQQLPHLRGRRERLQHELHRAAAGQAKAARLLAAIAVASGLRQAQRQLAARHAANQIIFNAAARDGTGHLPVIANDHQRARRARR